MNETANQNNDRTWEMLCHLSALAGVIGIPAGNILGPLIIWLVKKNEMPGIEPHAKESLNFQISMTIYMIVSSILIFVVIGFPLLVGLMIFDLVCIVIASFKAKDGVPYQYPITIRFLK